MKQEFDFLTIEEVSRELGVSRWIINKAVRDKKLQCVEISPRRRKIERSVLKKWVAAQVKKGK
jgi:excisionase family DNA binding protein